MNLLFAVSQTPQAHVGQFFGGVVIALIIVALFSGGKKR